MHSSTNSSITTKHRVHTQISYKHIMDCPWVKIVICIHNTARVLSWGWPASCRCRPNCFSFLAKWRRLEEDIWWPVTAGRRGCCMKPVGSESTLVLRHWSEKVGGGHSAPMQSGRGPKVDWTPVCIGNAKALPIWGSRLTSEQVEWLSECRLDIVQLTLELESWVLSPSAQLREM